MSTNSFSRKIEIENKVISIDDPTYFVADIAANHDGDLDRAKKLIELAAIAGADAVKFQHFSAKTIVSDFGFKSLGNQKSHQSSWKKTVFEVYKDAELNVAWNATLKKVSNDCGVTFFTSPYSLELLESVDPLVSLYKIGSGDITWHEIIEAIAKKNKPVLIAAGASNFYEVDRAIEIIARYNSKIVLMQCNTNYTSSLENFKHIHLNVLRSFSATYPGMILGLSDHTPGHATVLGSVALGARVIEKHFTDDNDREGPDHRFSMNPSSWKDMVARTRELENALGSCRKTVAENEKETVILQRRAIRVNSDFKLGHVISRLDLEVLRPCPLDAIPPYEIARILNKKLTRNISKGDYLRWEDIQD